MEKLRVGLVGLGKIAELHLSAYGEVEETEIVAGAEPDAERRRAVCSCRGLRGYATCAEMLRGERLDIACVLTPPANRRAVVEELAASGVHVLCEKPLALTVSDAEAMKAACEAAGVALCYGSSYRWLPACLKAREIIGVGALGAVRLLSETSVGGAGPESFHDLGPHHYPAGGPGGGGMGVMDHGIHMADVFPWLAGRPVAAVFGAGNISGAAPVPECVTMFFEGGAVGHLLYDEATYPTVLPHEGIFSRGATWSPAGDFLPGGSWDPQPGCIHVHGELGALRIFHYANKLFHSTRGGVEEIPLGGRPNPGHFGTQLEAFARSLLRGEPPLVGAREGIAALRVVLGVYESGRQRAVVPL